MAILTTLELIELYDTAITAILSGAQSYTLPNRAAVTRANLKEVQSERKNLYIQYCNEQNGNSGNVSVAYFNGR